MVEEPAVESIPKPEPEVIEQPEVVEEIPEPIPAVVEETIVEKSPEELEVIVQPEVVEEAPEPSPVVTEEDPLVRVVPEPVPLEEASRSSTKYTVQLLSLAKFSQSRLDVFCKQHNIPVGDVKKNQVGSWMKITYGEANSIFDAAKIKQQLKQNHGITDAFVVPVK